MEQYRTPNWKENDFDVVLFLFSPVRRASLFAPDSSFLAALVFVAGNAFSFLALWHSVPERAFYGTEYACRAQKGLLCTRRIFRGIRCKKQAFPVQKGYSVRRTASCGTRRIRIFGISPPSLVRNRSLGAKKGHHQNNTKQDKSCDLSCLVAGAGLEPTTSGL